MEKTIVSKSTVVLLLSLFWGFTGLYSQSLCIDARSDQIKGEKDGFGYELWNQNSQGTACMVLGKGALFSGEWHGVENYLARRGLDYDKTKRPEEIGTFFATYNCGYKPSLDTLGNSYLSVYGWSIEPLIEFYIVENWRNWIPSMASEAKFKGSFFANGSIYDIYENIRVNQPSIVGKTTFTQVFSIRRNTRSKGKINITKHFRQWQQAGLPIGLLDEVSFVVEGYQNSGSFQFHELDLFVK